ncbi:hypothetical protein D187_006999 [Cystobacter fuscus DSM 2262]|uniref:Uncharacterized protein n=1 Tax=Cystobacter fuscus (strain ATCC 25194 / DSM 2262 / NBRC 100088 / M29) TaxID=1242864 RepID=S9NYE9_CYSF2|nr:hypothetical protein [Cystobacter fuscus]EPX57245.1 hypothetical protein D187_006999 [Cystobacter fuscus DSM 2262]
MNRRRWPWLVLALVLLALGIIAMRLTEDTPPPPPRRPVRFAAANSDEAMRRRLARTTYVRPAAHDAGTEPPKPVDPFLEALPRGENHTAVVIEANAVRHSPLGEMLLECLLMQPQAREKLEAFRQHTGVDPLEGVDRVAVMDDGLAISGQFGQARMESMLPGEWRASAHGDKGRVYAPARPPTPSQGDMAAVGTWGDSMLVIGRTPEEVHGILDRIEGRGSSEPPVFGGSYAYGDVYGVVSVERLADSLPPEQRALGERLKQLAPRAHLNLDVSSDFALSVRLQGPDAERTADMAKAIGAAMALARFEAQSQGQTELARVLEYAGTSAMDDHLGVQLAVPLEVLRQELSWCRGASASGSTDAGTPEPSR